MIAEMVIRVTDYDEKRNTAIYFLKILLHLTASPNDKIHYIGVSIAR